MSDGDWAMAAASLPVDGRVVVFHVTRSGFEADDGAGVMAIREYRWPAMDVDVRCGSCQAPCYIHESKSEILLAVVHDDGCAGLGEVMELASHTTLADWLRDNPGSGF
jgi:hypothetical protein